MNGRIFSAALLAAALANSTSGQEVTFNKDIAPIVFQNCARCHRPGEVGPFSLLSYNDAAKRADFLAEVVASRRMPPWKPEPDFGHFMDALRLSDEQIQLFTRWAKTGAKEGRAEDLPPQPKFSDGWQLGEPDLVLKMAEPFTVPASGRDVYRCFVIPIDNADDKMIAAVEFRPGNSRVVHHAILYTDTTGAGRKRDELDKDQGYATFGGPGITPTGGLGGWAPGATPRFLPDGIARYLKKGSDLVLQLHYHPSGKAEPDQSSVGVYFSRKPVKQIVAGVAVRSRKLDIPAGESRHRVTAETEPLPAAVDARGIFPHMHNVGREMKVFATLPDSDQTVPLIWIKDWDFNWQGAYQYAAPVRLPKGAVIHIESYYDNSDSNPRNPNHPPKAVHWGEQTNDEMCLCVVQVTADTIADLRAIVGMRNNELGQAIGGAVAGFFGLGKSEPLSSPVAIPDRYKLLLNPFDKDGDGKLSPAEVEAIPDPLRSQVKRAAQRG